VVGQMMKNETHDSENPKQKHAHWIRSLSGDRISSNTIKELIDKKI